MARVTHMGPWIQAGPVAPQQEHSWAIGPWPADFNGTWTIAAHPSHDIGSRYPQAMAVTFVQTAVDIRGQHYVNFVVRNSHTTSVAAYSVWLSISEVGP